MPSYFFFRVSRIGASMSQGRQPLEPKSTSDGLPLARALSTGLSLASAACSFAQAAETSMTVRWPSVRTCCVDQFLLLLLEHVVACDLGLHLVQRRPAAGVLVLLVELGDSPRR